MRSRAAAIVHKEFDETPPADVLAEYAYEVIPSRMESAASAGKPVGWSDPAEVDENDRPARDR